MMLMRLTPSRYDWMALVATPLATPPAPPAICVEPVTLLFDPPLVEPHRWKAELRSAAG